MTSIAPVDKLSPTAAPAATRGDAPPASPPAAQPPTNIGAGGFRPSIDPALGITVLQFFSASGEVIQSFPSQHQLDSYRLYGLDAGKGPADA
jgi:hypothetical protein